MEERQKAKRGIRRTWWKCEKERDGAWNERLVTVVVRPKVEYF
jgi:hypothetical protein